MTASACSVPLAQVAALNPRLLSALSDGTLVSFVPMASVSAEEAKVTLPVDRPYAEVRKGYTYFETGDVLVAKITPCFENGKIAQALLPRQYGFGSTEFHVVRPASGKLDGRYLHHFLRQARIRVEGERRMTGSGGQRRVPEDFLAHLSLPLPPLPEQRRIAAILDQADALRAKRREALAQLDSLTQSVFIEMFGEPVANCMKWPELTFDQTLCDETSRATKTLQADYLDAGAIPVIDQGQKAVAGYVNEQAKLCPCELPVIVFGDHTRTVKLITFPFAVGADGAKVLVPKAGVSAVYVAHLLRLLPIPNLGYSRHMKELKRLLYPNPPIALQQTFATRIQAVESLKVTHRAALAELDALFASLQHRAFAGQLS